VVNVEAAKTFLLYEKYESNVMSEALKEDLQLNTKLTISMSQTWELMRPEKDNQYCLLA
jgi:hypothetical protein